MQLPFNSELFLKLGQDNLKCCTRLALIDYTGEGESLHGLLSFLADVPDGGYEATTQSAVGSFLANLAKLESTPSNCFIVAWDRCYITDWRDAPSNIDRNLRAMWDRDMMLREKVPAALAAPLEPVYLWGVWEGLHPVLYRTSFPTMVYRLLQNGYYDAEKLHALIEAKREYHNE